MTQTNKNEYPYPYNAWITGILPLQDFIQAFRQNLRDRQASLSPRDLQSELHRQYQLLEAMVDSFNLPLSAARELVAMLAEANPDQPYSSHTTAQSEESWQESTALDLEPQGSISSVSLGSADQRNQEPLEFTSEYSPGATKEQHYYSSDSDEEDDRDFQSSARTAMELSLEPMEHSPGKPTFNMTAHEPIFKPKRKAVEQHKPASQNHSDQDAIGQFPHTSKQKKETSEEKRSNATSAYAQPLKLRKPEHHAPTKARHAPAATPRPAKRAPDLPLKPIKSAIKSASRSAHKSSSKPAIRPAVNTVTDHADDDYDLEAKIRRRQAQKASATAKAAASFDDHSAPAAIKSPPSARDNRSPRPAYAAPQFKAERYSARAPYASAPRPKSRTPLVLAITCLLLINAALVVYMFYQKVAEPDSSSANAISDAYNTLANQVQGLTGQFMGNDETPAASEASDSLGNTLSSSSAPSAPAGDNTANLSATNTSNTDEPSASPATATTASADNQPLPELAAAISSGLETTTSSTPAAATAQPAPSPESDASQTPAAAEPAVNEPVVSGESVQSLLVKLTRQASELNIEPITDQDSALFYLSQLDAMNASPAVLSRAHASLQNGYEALSILAKARGQVVESQQFLNKAQNHERAAQAFETNSQ